MLVLFFALFGSFLDEVMVADIEAKGPTAQVRVPTESEMRSLPNCRASDRHPVLPSIRGRGDPVSCSPAFEELVQTTAEGLFVATTASE